MACAAVASCPNQYRLFIQAGDRAGVVIEPNPSVEPSTGRIIIVMPTYNERQNLQSIAVRVRAALPAADLLIVDDNSPDGTGDIADKLAEGDPHVQVMHRTEKAGLGKAYIAAFDWALERGYDVIVEMDADGSHQPERLPSLVGALAQADLSIGSRWMPGGKVVNWPRVRQAALSRRQCLHPAHARPRRPGRHRGLPRLSCLYAGEDQPERGRVDRILFPD